jgi:hypothetical protein
MTFDTTHVSKIRAANVLLRFTYTIGNATLFQNILFTALSPYDYQRFRTKKKILILKH